MPADARQVKAAVEAWSTRVHSMAIHDMPRQMQSYAPQGDTGKLRQSIHVGRDTRRAGSHITGEIVADVIQARTTDQGARPHIIKPKRRGGVLAFSPPKGWSGPVSKQGKVVVRYVNHPGNQPRPWWRRALNATYLPSLRNASLRIPFR